MMNTTTGPVTGDDPVGTSGSTTTASATSLRSSEGTMLRKNKGLLLLLATITMIYLILL